MGKMFPPPHCPRRVFAFFDFQSSFSRFLRLHLSIARNEKIKRYFGITSYFTESGFLRSFLVLSPGHPRARSQREEHDRHDSEDPGLQGADDERRRDDLG